MRHSVVAILLFAVSTTAATFSDVAKKYTNFTVGNAADVREFHVAVGHARFDLQSGSAAPVMAGDESVGLFLTGTGTWTYEAADPDEFSALRFNAKHAGLNIAEANGKLVLTQPFTSALLIGDQLPPVPAGNAAVAVEFQANRDLFAREAYAPPIAHVLVQRTLDNPTKHLLHAEIASGRQSFVYDYDDVASHAEKLRVLHSPQFRINADKNVLYATPLSRQAIGRSGRVVAPPPILLTALDVALVGDDEQGTLRVIETLIPQRSVNVIQLDQRDEVVYDVNNRSMQRHYKVTSVTDAQGRRLSFDHRGGELLIGLAEPAPAGAPVKLTFEITGDFLYRPEGSNYWQLGIAPWFPWTEWTGQRYTYHALVKVKKPFVPFTTGTTVRRTTEGEYNVLETKCDQPISGVAILAGRYEFDEETRDGVTVRVASFMTKNATAYKQLKSIAFAAIKYYPTFLGPFPFDELNVIEMNDLGYGQAPPGIVFITREAFKPKFEEENDYVKGVNMRFAHEIAHQYWGNAVRMASFEEQWIEEAFAEYSAALFMKAAGRPQDFDNSLNRWKADAAQAASVASIPMANRLDNPSDDLTTYVTRTQLLYGKGPVVLTALHKELGDQAFLTFLKSYQRSFRGKFGTTKDVAGLLQFMTKKDYGPFFERYYWGLEIPK